MTVKVMPPWMPTHLSSLSKLFLFYPFKHGVARLFVEFVEFVEVMSVLSFHSKRQKDSILKDRESRDSLNLLVFLSHAKSKHNTIKGRETSAKVDVAVQDSFFYNISY